MSLIGLAAVGELVDDVSAEDGIENGTLRLATHFSNFALKSKCKSNDFDK